MALYKEQFNKFNVMREILINRYMLTTLLVNINNVIYYLEGKHNAINELLNDETKKKMRQTLKYKDTVQFENFSLSARYFNALSKKFNPDNVATGCLMMDNYLKDNLEKQLSQSTINKRVKEYIQRVTTNARVEDSLKDAVRIATSLDYKLIDNETLARQYIAGTPSYMRTLDEGCKYLKERFNI